MSLKAFHVFFIAVSVVLFLGIATVQGSAYSRSGSLGDLALSAAAAAGGIGLVAYGIAFLRKTRKISFL